MRRFWEEVAADSPYACSFGASADGSNLTLYVNGAQVANGPEATITDTPATHVSFGATSDFTVEWFDGSLDEPAIYTHALAAARVLAHYQAGIGN